MNIFVLHRDPKIAAIHACDQHVVKMVTETAQILSTVCHAHGAPAPYRRTHVGHPCVRWAGMSRENYRWLWRHGMALAREYTHRYGKRHKAELALLELQIPPERVPTGTRTPFEQCMPKEYQVPGDAVTAYRRFYTGDKSRFARWSRVRKPPRWYTEGVRNAH